MCSFSKVFLYLYPEQKCAGRKPLKYASIVVMSLMKLGCVLSDYIQKYNVWFKMHVPFMQPIAVSAKSALNGILLRENAFLHYFKIKLLRYSDVMIMYQFLLGLLERTRAGWFDICLNVYVTIIFWQRILLYKDAGKYWIKSYFSRFTCLGFQILWIEKSFLKTCYCALKFRLKNPCLTAIYFIKSFYLNMTGTAK